MAPKGQGGIVKEGDTCRAHLQCEGKKVIGPRRQGPEAATQAERDLDVLRKSNISMAILERAASALKSAAAASETPAEEKKTCMEKMSTISDSTLKRFFVFWAHLL
jgi:hypothetical protein